MTKYAKTYGGALYDLAAEDHLTKEILGDLSKVLAVLNEFPDYIKLMQTPSVQKSEKHDLIDEAWKGNLNPYTINFMKLLCDNGKFSEIKSCEEEYHRRFNEDHNIIVAHAVSAAPISDELKEKLVKALAAKTQKTVELTVTVDESLIGGMKLELEGVQLDGTVSYHLGAIKNLLKGNLN